MSASLSTRGRIGQEASFAASLAQVALLLLAFVLMASSAIRKSPTVDEQSHLFRGIAYLKTGTTHFLLGHPLFGSTLAALPLLTEPELRLPVDEPYWKDGNWSLAADAFLWRLNENPQRLIFLGRLVVMWETLMFGALVVRWGKQLAGYTAGIFAGTLLLLDPNVLAHGRLVTNDMPITLFYALTLYGYWRWAQDPRRRNLLLAGIGLGLAAASKYNAAFLLPILGLQGLVLAWRRKRWRPLVVLLWVGLIGGAVIWAIYAFALRPLPGGAFWDDLLWTVDYFGKPHGSFLFGQVSSDGWWYYFPIAFILKTPLPTLFLLLGALLMFIRDRRHNILGETRGLQARRSGRLVGLYLLLPAVCYAAVSLASSINIGYRYLLPMAPFLFLFIAVTLANTILLRNRRIVMLLFGSISVIAIISWPDYIPFFNVLAGGSGNGWRLLSDSNVDWGQDLPALAKWQRQQGRPIRLSYFGTAHPSAYDIDFESLPTWAPAPEQTIPTRQPFNPSDPAPGVYAISVTNLHGIVLGEERDAYAWFREKSPLITLGNSIFVYEVTARGAPADVAFSGLKPSTLSPQLHAQFRTNHVRVRWFDARTSFIWPESGGWAAVVTEQSLLPSLAGLWPEQPLLETPTQSLYRLPAPPQLPWLSAGTDLDGVVQFLGFQMLETAPDHLALLTAWRALSTTDRPLKIFVHALSPDDQIIGQWDGLHIESVNWLPGDVFVQFHRFDIPGTQEIVSGRDLRLVTGMYDGETQVPLSGRILLQD